MNGSDQLGELRALRDEAWAVVRTDIESLRVGLEERGVGERIKDRALGEAQDAWGHAVDVAADNKGVVAATLLALIAWFLRGPIGTAFEAVFGNDDPDSEPDEGESVQGGEGDHS